MEDTKKIDLFEKMPVKSAVLKLSIPTVLSSLVMVIYNLADTYFVGILNDPVENAAVTLAAPLLLAFNAVNNLFGVGSSSMMSRALGKKDYETVYRSSAFGFYCSVISGLMFSLFYTAFSSRFLVVLGADAETIGATAEYLKWTVSFGAVPSILNVVMAYLVRAEGASLHASIGTMSGCVLNMILDPIFVLPWGLDMGAAGAGCATFISNCAACMYFFILLYVKRKSTCVCVNPKKFSFRKAIVVGVFSVGIPASIQNLLNVTGMTVLNNFTSAFGADAVAAMGIAQKINMVPMQIAYGSSQGVMPLIGYTYASGNTDRMKKSLLFLSKYALGFVAIMAAGFYFGSETLISLFMNNETIVSYGSAFLKGFCLSLVFLCMDFIAVGVFQACGMGGKSLVFAIMRKIVLEIPFIFLLNYLFPLYGLAYAQTAAEVILASVAVAVLIKMFKRFKTEHKKV
ncbi:MAG: MATE family efflux transporter [Eubacterium sp.]|nr:MATE family efflux transporter [Eubacterium sp.]